MNSSTKVQIFLFINAYYDKDLLLTIGVTAAKVRGRKYIRNKGNGITRAYGKCANISGAITPVATDIDLTDYFSAKYAMPSATSPKVIFKWFYVNPTTGEKSGEMLAVESFVDPDTP